jgi:hypothetical protein
MTEANSHNNLILILIQLERKLTRFLIVIFKYRFLKADGNFFFVAISVKSQMFHTQKKTRERKRDLTKLGFLPIIVACTFMTYKNNKEKNTSLQ